MRRTRSVGSPTPLADQSRTGAGTAKGTTVVIGKKCIAEPELVISTSEAQEWYRRNPHARAGVLEDLAARGILVIVPDALAAGIPVATATPPGVQA